MDNKRQRIINRLLSAEWTREEITEEMVNYILSGKYYLTDEGRIMEFEGFNMMSDCDSESFWGFE
jgi:hypothetical protein